MANKKIYTHSVNKKILYNLCICLISVIEIRYLFNQPKPDFIIQLFKQLYKLSLVLIFSSRVKDSLEGRGFKENYCNFFIILIIGR